MFCVCGALETDGPEWKRSSHKLLTTILILVAWLIDIPKGFYFSERGD